MSNSNRHTKGPDLLRSGAGASRNLGELRTLGNTKSQNGDTSTWNLILENLVFIVGRIAYDRLVRASRPTRDRR